MSPPAPTKLEEHLSSSTVARILGIKTNTLARWRSEGKGPQCHFHLNPRTVLYPVSGVETYLDELKRERTA